MDDDSGGSVTVALERLDTVFSLGSESELIGIRSTIKSINVDEAMITIGFLRCFLTARITSKTIDTRKAPIDNRPSKHNRPNNMNMYLPSLHWI